MIRYSFALFFLLTSFGPRKQKPEKEIKTIMAVFAHPDDESFMSPVLSKYAMDGHRVFLVLATNGEKGTRDYTGIPAGAPLAAKRKSEAACVTEKLGLQPPVFLDLNDGELDVDFTGAPLRKKLDSVYKIYKPDVVITWGPEGGYGHVDHRMVHNVVTELFQSGLSEYPSALYYSAVPTSQWRKNITPGTGLGKFFHGAWKPVDDRFLTVRIRCGESDVKRSVEALQCHWSQFNKEEMNDIRHWLSQMNSGDTVYLRPFAGDGKMRYTLL